MTQGVNQSQFYMWRTLFAVAHADNIVTDEEIEFMAHILEDVQFSDEQTEILKDDILNAKDVELMFKNVTDQNDRVHFFDLARDLVWVDGDFGDEEQSVMIKLHRQHFKNTNVDDLIGHVPLSLEDDPQHKLRAPDHKRQPPRKHNTVKDALFSFRRRFLGLIDRDN